MLTPPDESDQEEPTATVASPGDDRGIVRPRMPEPSGLPSNRTNNRTRAATLWGALGFGVFFLLAVLIFIIQNGARARVHFVTLQGTLPLGVALLLAAVGGALVAVFLGAVRITQLRRVASRHRRDPT